MSTGQITYVCKVTGTDFESSLQTKDVTTSDIATAFGFAIKNSIDEMKSATDEEKEGIRLLALLEVAQILELPLPTPDAPRAPRARSDVH